MVNPGKSNNGPQNPENPAPPSDPVPGFVIAGRRNRMPSQSPSRKESTIPTRKDSIPTIQQRRESLTGQSSHQRKSSVERPPSRKNSLTSPFFNFPGNAGLTNPRTTPPPTGPGSVKTEVPAKIPEVPAIIPEVPTMVPEVPARIQEVPGIIPELPAKRSDRAEVFAQKSEKPEIPAKKSEKQTEVTSKKADKHERSAKKSGKLAESLTKKSEIREKSEIPAKNEIPAKISETPAETPAKMSEKLEPTTKKPETPAKKPEIPAKKPEIQAKKPQSPLTNQPNVPLEPTPKPRPSLHKKPRTPTTPTTPTPKTPPTPITPSTLGVPKVGSPMFPRIDIPDKCPGSPRMSSKSKKKHRQRLHRHTSNVFSMFNQAQIQEFKEAFNMIDQNRDGFIDRDDLIEVYTSLGKNPTDDLMEMMLREAPGPINFTMFLTLFGEKLNGTDPEDVIRNAFACFDLIGRGELTEEYLREIMTTMGDRWSHDMVDELLFGVPIQAGKFDYIEFTRVLKHGAKEKDEKNENAQQPAQMQR